MLTRHGYETAAAADGVQALEILAEDARGFDLALLDFVMPKMNGFQFCRALQSRTDIKLLPVVLMSAKTDKIREHFVLQTGAVDALAKPFDSQTLIRAVDGALRRAKSGWAPSASQLDLADLDESASSPSPPSVGPNTRRTRDFGALLASVVKDALVALPRGAIGDHAAVMHAVATGIGDEGLARLTSALAGSAKPVLAGSLAVVPIGAVLQLLQLESMSGRLSIGNAHAEVIVTMRSGLIDLAEARGVGDEFKLGRYLIEAGLVTAEQVGALVGAAQSSSGSGVRSAPTADAASAAQTLLGEQLLQGGMINAEQLKEALLRQSSELIYEALRWPDGHFEFSLQREGPVAARARLGASVAGIVMEGFRRVDEWRVIEAKIGSFDAVLLSDDAASGAEKLTSQEMRVVGAVDGARTVREVVAASHLSSFDACRVLVQLLGARVVRRRAA